jgi:hypothetical protein
LAALRSRSAPSGEGRNGWREIGCAGRLQRIFDGLADSEISRRQSLRLADKSLEWIMDG